MPLVSMLAALAMVGVGVVGWWLVKKKNSAGSNQTVQNAAGAPAAAKVAPDGFENLFNGRDLTGWSGDPRFWSVEAEAITAYSEGGWAATQPSCLIWQGGNLRDFELRLLVRFTVGNSGIYYRGRDLGAWNVGGYQFEIWSSNTGNLIDNGTDRNRRDLARGQKGINVGAFKKGAWNNLVITAKGNHLTHQINGEVVADVVDTDRAGDASGILALELHGGGTSVQFKDLRLKRL